MATDGETTNWFDTGSSAYAAFRPDYPDTLVSWLASIAPDTDLAVDIGCGTGQLTARLAEHFAKVIGVDPSANQLAHARSHPQVEYRQAPAEHLQLPEGSASLAVAAQAAHWFDLPRFYQEVRQIGRPGAVLALISYGVPRFDEPHIQQRFAHFYAQEIGPFWPPERRLVDEGYASIEFPFPEITAPPFVIERSWNRTQTLGYFSTWSAWKHAITEGQAEIINAFQNDLIALWPREDDVKTVTWPVVVRAGIIQ